MFKKWSQENNKIALFMQNLDPRKIYTNTEMVKLCKEYSIQLSHLCTDRYSNGSVGYGKIIEKTGETYKLYSRLIQPFEQNF